MNHSAHLARSIVGDLLSAGVVDVVISPGSRSAALAFAFAQAHEAGLLRMHIRIDERDAGFLALGLAKATRRIVPVLVTSGSAVANLFPAVVEAYQSGVSLLALTADRPESARGSTSPQTMNQKNFFGSYVTASLDLSSSEQMSDLTNALTQINSVRRLPAHINVQFEPPLMPESVAWPELREFTKSVSVHSSADTSVESLQLPAHGLVVVGDTNGVDWSSEISNLAGSLGWPVLWEPTSNVHTITEAIPHGPLLLASEQLPVPECVITIGTVGLSRSVLGLLNATAHHIAIHLPTNGPLVPDPISSAERIVQGIPRVQNHKDSGWMSLWTQASAWASHVIDDALSATHLTGPNAAVTLWNHANTQSQLVIAASWPVRHIEAFAKPRPGLKTFGNRGVNGIDGLISTAWGVSVTSPAKTYLLIGDVATLHDIGGLVVPEGTEAPNLTIVILDNDGGGIFSQLEQAQPDYSAHYERIFGTPHGKDLWVIIESLGIPAHRVTTISEFRAALQRTDAITGIQVIVCTTGHRRDEVALLNKISAEVTRTLAEKV